MSFVGDALGFEKFQLSDWWRKIKKNPEQLLIGAGDPWSAKMWGKILGKDYEPFVDQMGGPYGGSTFSMYGNNDGGVYGRAKAAGVDTKAASGIHDGAHTIAALFAGNYGLDKLGSLGGAGGSGGEAGAAGGGSGTSWSQYANMMPQQQNQPIVDPAEEERKRKEKEAAERRAAQLALSLRLSGNQGLA